MKDKSLENFTRKEEYVHCVKWMNELKKRIVCRRDSYDNYPETEYGKRCGLDEAIELLTTLQTEMENSLI